MVLKYKNKNFKYHSQMKKSHRSPYSYGGRSFPKVALASVRRMRSLQKRIKKSNRPIRIEFYKKYHRKPKRQKRRLHAIRKPARRHVYLAKLKPTFYCDRQFNTAVKAKRSVKKFTSKFSTSRRATAARRYKTSSRKSVKVFPLKKARKQQKKMVSTDGVRKNRSSRRSRPLLKSLKKPAPLTEEILLCNENKNKVTSANISVQTKTENLPDKETKDTVSTANKNVFTKNADIGEMASTSQCTDYATASNIDYFEKACGTSEDEERRESVGFITAGDTELTAVKGSLDLTAAVDVDPTPMVDGADLTADVNAVDSIPPIKMNADTSEVVVVETETLGDPMEDELPHEMMAKNDFFKAEVDEPLSGNVSDRFHTKLTNTE